MTLTQLRTKVLQRLQVLATGENPDPDDGQVVADRYPSIHAILMAKNLASWSITEDIPDYLEVPMVNIVAYACATEFGITGQLMGQLALEGALNADPISLGERQLRSMQADTYKSEPAQSEYF